MKVTACLLLYFDELLQIKILCSLELKLYKKIKAKVAEIYFATREMTFFAMENVLCTSQFQ